MNPKATPPRNREAAPPLKATERWYSHRMGRELSLVRWGSYGVPVLLFPTAGGDAAEIDRMGLLGAIWPLVDAGRIKVYSCDSAAGMAMVAHEGSPEHRQWLFNQYQQAIAAEVVPAIQRDSPGAAPIIAAGASIGAFNALAVTCRFPELFGAAVCMSGTFSIERFIGAPFTDDLYYASPLSFLAGLGGAHLDTLRQRFIILAHGEALGGSGQRAAATSSAPRASRTGSTTGARASTTTGPPGIRCSRSISTTSSRDLAERLAPSPSPSDLVP